MFWEVVKSCGRRAPLPPPLATVAVVVEVALVVCTVAKEVLDLLDDKEGGG